MRRTLKKPIAVATHITKGQVLKELKKTKGRIFSAVFTKLNGDLRTMVARLGVKKNQVGGYSTTAHITKYVDVFDMHANDYRKINLDTLVSIQINGTKYIVI